MNRALVRIAVAALLVVACTSPEERLARHIERGEAYVRNAETEAALLEFQSALKIQPENAELYERIGDVLMEYSQLYPEAVSYYQEAYRLDPTRVHSQVREARLIAQYKPTRARQLVDQALETHPDRAEVWRANAFLALIGNDLEEARKSAEKAIELEPSPPSYAELGGVYLAHIAADRQRKRPPDPENFEGALEAFRKVDELKGGHYARAILEQARVYSYWGKNAEAEALFRQGMTDAQKSGLADLQLASSLAVAFARQVDNAELERDALRALVDADEDDYTAWRDLARVAERLPDTSGDAVYAELLAKRPDDPKVHLLWTEYLVESDRARDARVHLRHALDEGMDDPALYEALIRLELQLGGLARARTLEASLEEKHPDADETRVARARLALAEDRYDEAERTLKGLTAEHPTPELLRMLAVAQLGEAQPLEARQTLARALEATNGPKFTLWRLSALIESEAGNWAGVKDALVKLLVRGQTLSDNERVLFARAAYHTGHEKKAREVLRKMLLDRPIRADAAVAYAKLFGADDPVYAIATLRVAHATAVGRADVLRELSFLEARAGRGMLALARLNKLIGEQRAGPGTVFVRAELLASMGAWEQAEADALVAFEADPSLPGAVDLLHQLYRAQGKLETARLAFEEADAAGVLHPGARLLLARLLIDDGEKERAVEMLERVVKENPELWQAKADLAVALATPGGDNARAMTLARDAFIASGRTAETGDALGWVHLQSGRPQAALLQFRRSVEMSERAGEPAPPTFYYHVGLAYRALDRDSEADEAFQTALGQGEFPEAEDARRQLEAARHQPGDTGSSS